MKIKKLKIVETEVSGAKFRIKFSNASGHELCPLCGGDARVPIGFWLFLCYDGSGFGDAICLRCAEKKFPKMLRYADDMARRYLESEEKSNPNVEEVTAVLKSLSVSPSRNQAF